MRATPPTSCRSEPTSMGMTALLLTEVKVGSGDECCVMVAAGAAERMVRVTDRERESECVAAGQPE